MVVNGVLQPQFNQISYLVIGDDTAPSYFDVGSSSGIVTTRVPLTSENVNRYYVSCIPQRTSADTT